MPDARPIAPGLFTETADGPRLLAGRCAACTRPHFPAGPVCPYCAADGCTETAVGPKARLYLYTAVSTRPTGYRGEVAIGFGVVEFECGIRGVNCMIVAQ